MQRTKSVNPKHFVGIDALRFFAALLVVLYHHGYYLTVGADRANIANQHLVVFPELAAYSYFGHVGVQIFFVISGFVIAFSGEKASPFQFMVSRIARLGPGVWICASITLFATLLVGFPVLREIKLFVQSILFVPIGTWIDGAYWTLGIEIAFYGMVFLLIKFDQFRKIRQLAIIIGIISTVFSVISMAGLLGYAGTIGHIAVLMAKNRFFDLTLVHHGMFFALGVFLWLELVKKSNMENRLWCGIFILAGCLQIAAVSGYPKVIAGTAHNANHAIEIFVLAILAFIFSVRFNSLIHKTPQKVLIVVQTAGLMTFPLYLLHQIAGNAVMGSFVRLGMNKWTALSLTVLLTLITAWFVATQLEPKLQEKTKTCLYWLNEKIKIYRKPKQLKMP